MTLLAAHAASELETHAPFDGRPPAPAQTRADAMARFEGDEVFYERIVPLFCSAATEQACALVEATSAGDRDAIQHWAHTLKGSLLTVGATRSAELAEDVERAGRECRLEGLPARVRRLVAENAIIVAHLSATDA
ncbi:MAG: Hpt domain-containing protein [Burkholderiales bacterium]|nr:MAG: Hpt domain-containing protein [Burkholderiales bacterium]